MTQNYPIGFQPSHENNKQNHRLLIVILHGWLGSPDQMKDVAQAVNEAYTEEYILDFYIPPLGYSKFFSSKSSGDIVNELLQGMDTICQNPDQYSGIVLIGFSLGSVFIRRLFLEAAFFAIENNRPQHWVCNVKRIISLGGLNRGWLSSGRLGWAEAFVTNTIGLLGHIWPDGKPVIFEARRGAPFIVQTRLKWLALRRLPLKWKPEPLVIQLLGTQDNLVAPDDAVDFAVDRSKESPYFYVELPHTRHDNAIVFSPSRFDRNGEFGAARKAQFIDVLTSDNARLMNIAINSNYLADTLPEEPNESVDHVVFVIHGIRDDGYWTRKIAQKIHESTAYGDTPTVRCITSSYGYFAMLPFLLPWIRRQKVEWLMDEYVDARSRFPKAKFSYVGHSNGTYLIARALQDYPAACFSNVLFAGSVVRRNYDWAGFIAAKRVGKVVNMVATRDWVVALFPQGLEPLRRFFDLGGAGFGGFDQFPKVTGLSEVQYVIGGHSAGLVETQWKRIADFIVHGTVPTPPDQDYASKQSCFWKAVSKISTVLLVILVGLLIAAFVCILYPVFVPGTTAINAFVHTLLAVFYLMVLRFIFTRV